ncbi:unnamed protein product [Adineta steineri]|uniref:Uncharacterized protein n=1 Tax=Adineta steineri TaxID=433720 RepID=A0A813UYZ7_9BILA|nr:unnamed protein product [Adineta steineri]CAF0918722.1 unnamed protein product [Adineta steineri]CAF3556113.1 unnamed protein product [Adineta steineri]CAF3561321.1 unnamed protein product [Adineta steineri]
MLNCKSEENTFDENDFSSIIGSSLRNVIEKSVTDLVLPYRILSLSHLSSWNTFQKDITQILKRNSTTNEDFILLNYFDSHRNYFNEKQKEKHSYFQSLINYQMNFIPIKSDFDRLCQFM